MDISGETYRNLREGMLESFTRPELRSFMMYEFDIKLDNITLAGSMGEQVDMVIDWIDRRDLEKKLFAALCKTRPNNKRFADLSLQFAAK